MQLSAPGQYKSAPSAQQGRGQPPSPTTSNEVKAAYDAIRAFEILKKQEFGKDTREPLALRVATLLERYQFKTVENVSLRQRVIFFPHFRGNDTVCSYALLNDAGHLHGLFRTRYPFERLVTNHQSDEALNILGNARVYLNGGERSKGFQIDSVPCPHDWGSQDALMFLSYQHIIAQSIYKRFHKAQSSLITSKNDALVLVSLLHDYYKRELERGLSFIVFSESPMLTGSGENQTGNNLLLRTAALAEPLQKKATVQWMLAAPCFAREPAKADTGLLQQFLNVAFERGPFVIEASKRLNCSRAVISRTRCLPVGTLRRAMSQYLTANDSGVKNSRPIHASYSQIFKRSS